MATHRVEICVLYFSNYQVAVVDRDSKAVYRLLRSYPYAVGGIHRLTEWS